MDSNINSINNELNGNQNQLIDENSINNNNNNNEINLDSINTKKVKLDSNEVQSKPEQNQRQQQSNQSNQVKSRVVHVRNIPMDSTENDLISIAMSFGRVTNCLILRGKSQAFIEFMSSESAQQMINYWLQTTVAGVATQLQPTIRGRHVFCQLSNHKELKTNNNSLNINSNHNSLQNNNNNSNDNHLNDNQSVSADNRQTSITPSCVIRVVVENLLYSVSLEILHSVFSRAGKVSKIVTFTKNGSFQALIQFNDVSNAIQAKHLLDGQNLFHSANTLRIEFSKLQQLNVKYNNDKSRDYTNPSLPSMTAQTSEDALMSSLIPNSAYFQINQSVNALRALNPLHALQQLGGISASAQHLAQLTGGMSHSLTAQQLNASNGQLMSSSVLLVSNLNESTTTTDALFTLFGVYGDVIRVKILFNKKDNALVQMSEPAQAQLAHTYLDKVKLNGRVIRVTQSKHQLVQMPKEGQHDAGLTKDYSNSSLHRFKKPGSKNYGNIYPPSATLHLSNIPQGVTEEDIRSAFARETSCPVIAFKFFPKDRKMALIQMQSIDDAIQALIAMHNYQLSESSHLRVSFSKSSI